MTEKTDRQSIWNARLARRAAADSFRKLDPRVLMKNPVMFVVEVGCCLTTFELARGLFDAATRTADIKFELQITLWLWFTILFANFAEALAEGRGKAQAENLRKSKTETVAHRLLPNGATETVPATRLRKQDVV